MGLAQKINFISGLFSFYFFISFYLPVDTVYVHAVCDFDHSLCFINGLP